MRRKDCQICGSRIPMSARKCTHCGEFSSLWDRVFLGLNLSGLLSLLPIGVLAYAFLADRFERDFSELEIAAPRCEQTSASMFISNVGNKYAFIQKASFVAPQTEQGIMIFKTEEERLFPPGEARLVILQVPSNTHPRGFVSFAGSNQSNCEVTMHFDIVGFDGQIVERSKKCECLP